MSARDIDIQRIMYHRHPADSGAHVVKVRAGHRGTEHIVPPAGEDLAVDRTIWARTVEVYTSPAGRSVRVWVDGVEITENMLDLISRGGLFA
jgi:hypothetical protein